MEIEHGRIDLIPRYEMNEILENNFLGHLGCAHRDEVYVVPITYAFENPFIYSHSREGRKISLMRKNPHVCLEVDEVSDVFQWRSVIVTGLYEELKGEAAARGMRVLIQKISETHTTGNKRTSPLAVDFMALLEQSVIYRIRIKEISGRRERGF